MTVTDQRRDPGAVAATSDVAGITAGPAPADPMTAAGSGVFTRGSVVRHVLVMTGTATVGIMAIFVVDLLSLLYVARLGRTALTAGVGYASQVLFYPVAVNIGLAIGVTALVSRALGAGDVSRARRLAASGLTYAALLSGLVAAGLLPMAGAAVRLLGATGEPADVATRFLWITLPANVPFALGMVLSGVLRAAGDARRAMYVTLIGAVVTGIIDPILIFGLGLGADGAALSTVVARLVFLAVGAWGVVKVHGLVRWPTLASLLADLRPVLAIALPAVATNLATPVGNSFVLHVVSRFGHEAVAATTVIDRLVPVAFGVLFALSGAVGPVLGQNLGAGRFDRVNATLNASFGLVAGYVLVAWAALAVLAPGIVALFGVEGEAATYVTFFCRVGVSAWMFIGFLFVANASFNNLGFAWLSMVFNWGRASLGTIPFVALGAAYGGVIGAQIGLAAGAALFGLGALATAYVVTARLAGTAAPR